MHAPDDRNMGTQPRQTVTKAGAESSGPTRPASGEEDAICSSADEIERRDDVKAVIWGCGILVLIVPIAVGLVVALF